jgi:hypothetical protein
MNGLYEQIRATPQTPDLDLLWTLLGVPNDPKTEAFNDHAPLAAIRIAITARPAGGEPGSLGQAPANVRKN